MHKHGIQHKERFGSPTYLNSYTHVYGISVSQSEDHQQDGLIKQAVGSEAPQNMEASLDEAVSILHC